MAKAIDRKLKVVVPAGQATPAPPLGPTLGQAGINIQEFTQKFNDETKDRMGELVPTVITVYEDKSFTLEYKTPPTASLILKAMGIKKGSGKNLVKKAGTISKDQIREIAEIKQPDLNAKDLDAAAAIVAGQCHSMGIEVK